MKPWACSFLVLCVACAEQEKHKGDAIVVGALLPFTGSFGASGPSIERALIAATEEVNAAGGVDGKELVLKTLDTGSTSLAEETLATLVGEYGAHVIMGPETPDAALAVAAWVSASDNLTNLLPGIAAFHFETDVPQSGRVFDLNPSPEIIGCTVSRELDLAHVESVVVVHEPDPFHTEMAESLQRNAGDPDAVRLLVLDGEARILIETITQDTPDAIALFALPEAASAFLLDWSAFGDQGVQWYLPPTLDDEGFFANIIPGSIEGAVGLSQVLPLRTLEAFSTYYGDRWYGETPSRAAFIYYDAMMLVALALQEATCHADNFDALGLDLARVSLSEGVRIEWDGIADGLARVAACEPVNYNGLSGVVDLLPSGEQAQVPNLQFWDVHDNQPVFRDREVRCVSLVPP